MCRKTTIKQTSKSLNNKFTLGCVTYLIYIPVFSFSMFCKSLEENFLGLCTVHDAILWQYVAMFYQRSHEILDFICTKLWWSRGILQHYFIMNEGLYVASVLKNMALKSFHFSGWACRHHLILLWTMLVRFVSCSYACVWAGARYNYLQI